MSNSTNIIFSGENWFRKRVIWSTKGFINCRRLEVLWRGWNPKISCGAIHSISSAWNLPAVPFNLNFSRLWSVADLQLFDRTKTGLSLLQIFFSGVLKLICCLLSDFSSHIDSIGSTAPTGFELIVISMMMIIWSHRQAGRPLTPSDNSAPIYEPTLPLSSNCSWVWTVSSSSSCW